MVGIAAEVAVVELNDGRGTRSLCLAMAGEAGCRIRSERTGIAPGRTGGGGGNMADDAEAVLGAVVILG